MPTKGRAPLVLALVAVLLIGLAGRFRTDLDVQDGLDGPLGALLGAALAAGTFVATRRAEAQTQATGFTLAVWVAGAVSAAVLVPADELDWLSGEAFAAPLWLQLVVYGLAMVGWCALALSGFVVVARQSHGFALGLYAVFVAGWTAGGVAAVRGYEDDGVYVLDHGYSVLWDALWGVGMFAAALGVLELVRRRQVDATATAYPATAASTPPTTDSDT